MVIPFNGDLIKVHIKLTPIIEKLRLATTNAYPNSSPQ
jgi:hypothetical protein